MLKIKKLGLFHFITEKNVLFCDCTKPSVNSRAEALLTWFFNNTFGSFSLSNLTCPNALLKLLM